MKNDKEMFGKIIIQYNVRLDRYFIGSVACLFGRNAKAHALIAS
jgi:hypothetical protein